MRSKIIHWLQLIFTYPQRVISIKPTSHDEYWHARGKQVPELSPWQKERADIALSLIEEKRNKTIVDIGCGDGAILQYLNKKIQGIKGIGIDASERMVGLVSESGFEVHQVDFSEPSSVILPEADYMLLFEIIEHIHHAEVLVEKALQNAKEGIFISIPNSGFFVYRFRLLFGRFPVQWISHPSEHVRFWTLRDIKWWLKSLGWEKRATVHTYQGVPILKRIFPSWFAAGMVIYIRS